jgi:membrane dipeptidase
VLARHPVLDGHNDLAYAIRELSGYDLNVTDPGSRLDGTHTDLPRLRSGGVGGQLWSVYVPTSFAGADAVTGTLEQIDFVRRMIARHPSELALCRTAADAELAFAQGRIASFMAMEGGHCIDGSLGVLRQMYELGVRSMTLTHNDNTPWADSATDVPASGGLTALGFDIVREMNRLGMLVDLSHVTAQTMHAALDVTSAPVIFTHSSCRALVDHPRNVPDDVLRRLPDNGGVIMVTFVPAFVSQEYAEWDEQVSESMLAHGERPGDWAARLARSAEYARTVPRPRVTVAQVADHVEHARSVAGAGSVGIGGDYDGVDIQPEGLEDVSCYPVLFAELVERGWTDDELAALACRNALRALRTAQEVAAGDIVPA